jgi:hypothetical protein
MIPTYTLIEIGNQLREMVTDREDREEIGSWAWNIYHHSYLENETKEVNKLLLYLSAMEDGPEFYYSYEELEKIADDLIAGKEVKLG